MKKKGTLMMMTAGVALMSLAACSTDNNEASNGSAAQQLEIRLSSSSLAAIDATRSFTSTQLQSNDTVWVWTDMINGSTGVQTEYFKAWTLKTNGAGGLTPQVNGNAKLFPATNALNFYAIAGNFGKETDTGNSNYDNPKIVSEETTLPTTGILHTVLANQQDAADYYKSDLLYAVVKGQEPVAEAVQLPFAHMLSRIQVVLVAGNGMTVSDLSEATVTLLSLKRQVVFSPDSTKNFALQADRAGMLNIPNFASQGNLVMNNSAVATVADALSDATVYSDAIIVPQAIAAGAQLIKVSYLGRDTYLNAPTPDGLTFESGKQYRFRLIADRIGARYEQNVTVSDWDTPDNITKWVE